MELSSIILPIVIFLFLAAVGYIIYYSWPKTPDAPPAQDACNSCGAPPRKCRCPNKAGPCNRCGMPKPQCGCPQKPACEFC